MLKRMLSNIFTKKKVTMSNDEFDSMKEYLIKEHCSIWTILNTISKLEQHDIFTYEAMLSYMYKNGKNAYRRWVNVGDKTMFCIELLLIEAMRRKDDK